MCCSRTHFNIQKFASSVYSQNIADFGIFVLLVLKNVKVLKLSPKWPLWLLDDFAPNFSTFYRVIRHSNWHRICVWACVRSTRIFNASPDSLTFLPTQRQYKAMLKHLVPNIWHSEDRASWYILIIKPKRCTNFSNLFLE